MNSSDNRMLRYFESAPGYFYTLAHRPDGSYAILFASSGIRELCGVEPEAVVQDVSAFVAIGHPDDVEMTFRKTEESERDLSPYNVEYRIIHPQKGVRWLEVHSLPQRMEDGGTRWDGFMHDITERKQMEEALAVREREFRQQAQFQQSLLSGLRDAGVILVVVENGHFVYTNDHYVGRQLGYAEGQLPETVNFIELIHPDDRPRIVEMHRDRLAGKPTPNSYEIGALGGDGSRREYEFHVTLVPDTDPPQTQLLALDIAERKRAQLELQRREREFRTLVENTPDVVVRYDRECRRTYVNPAWERVNGMSVRDVLGKSPQELSVRVKPISADFERMLRGVMETGRADTMELNWRDEAGGQVYFELNAIPEFDSLGAAVSVLTVARDITEHRRMESELALREQAYRSLTENLPDNIARMDTAGRVLYSNLIHQRSLGKPAAEMLGKTFGELFPDGRYAPVEAAIAQVVATGQPVLFVRQPVPFENGETQIHDVNLVPERDADGNVISVLGIGRDMTEFYRLQDEIGARERQLRALADSSPGMMGAFYSRPDGSVCMPYVSPNIEELFGLRPQDVADDAAPLLALNHPDDARRVGESIAESARNMTVWHEEYRILHPTRGERWMESHTRPQPHPDGGVVWYGYVHDITGRKRIEQVLRRSQEMLADAQKIAQLGSWDWDVVGDRVEWSEMAYEIYTPDQRPAKPGFEDFKSSLHPDDLDRVVAAVQSAFERDTPFDLDHRVVSVSKGVRTVHAQGKVFRGADGKPVRMVGTVQDITERKQAEIALRERFDRINELNDHLEVSARNLEEQATELEASQEQLKQTEAWYRSIMHSAPDGMLVVDERGLIMQVNVRLEAMFGYERGELSGRSLEVLLPQSLRESHVGLRSGYWGSGADHHMAMVGKTLFGCRKDGSTFPVDVSLSRLPEIDGMSSAICAAVRDITERQKMEAAREAALAEALRLARLRSA
ncbi:MAG TPA: PAS domain S-box protein, partial [Gallionella sp.]|nr:PAS domain S-box protein [Gallionella sp.]